MSLPHPSPDQITLPAVLAALGDETRLAIVGCLARCHAPDGMVCGQFGGLTSKTNLTYHVAKLREAGVVTVRPEARGATSPCGGTTSTPAFRASWTASSPARPTCRWCRTLSET